MKRIWKYSILSAIFSMMLVNANTALAQDEAPLTDDDLRKYAVVMDFADQEKDRLKEEYNSMIQAEELMDGGRRFKELKEAGDDEAKLAEISATPEEIEIFKKIETANDANVEAFKEAYTEKIKDNDQLGAGLYNRINKALKSDQEVKARFTAIFEAIQSERATNENEGEQDEPNEGQ